jgi:hypothetical protein
MKQGRVADFHLFSEKSMIHGEIANQTQGLVNCIETLVATIAKKQETISCSRTPKEVCIKYGELENRSKSLVNKKRKEVEKEMTGLLDQYRNLKQDKQLVDALVELEQDYQHNLDSVAYLQNYLREQTNLICQVMIEEGFITMVEEGRYEMLPLGAMATHIAEIHPLILTKRMSSVILTTKQWVGLFSCFTDVNVPNDLQMRTPPKEDIELYSILQQLQHDYQTYGDREAQRDIRTGLRYEDALQFNLVDLSMKWCDQDTEVACKGFIQGEVADRGISVGDFTKAMMKIVTIAKEWMNVCESAGWVERKHIFSEIEGMILKYVLTTQSLYV